MSSDGFSVSRDVYVVVLRKDDASPMAPESDEEKAEEKNETAKDEKPKAPDVRSDLEGIDQRVLALPIPGRDYVGMAAGKTGILFLSEAIPNAGPG